MISLMESDVNYLSILQYVLGALPSVPALVTDVSTIVAEVKGTDGGAVKLQKILDELKQLVTDIEKAL